MDSGFQHVTHPEYTKIILLLSYKKSITMSYKKKHNYPIGPPQRHDIYIFHIYTIYIYTHILHIDIYMYNICVVYMRLYIYTCMYVL